MHLPVNIAQMIVNTLEKNVGYKINFMDANGIIIASSDHSRIGKSHEGALIVIDTNKPIIIYPDTTLENSREGINLPVEFNNEVVGTVGITGEIEKVKGFGTIIKTMTEILIQNYFTNNLRQYEIEREQAIVYHLLYQSEVHSQTKKEEKIIHYLLNNPSQVIVWKYTDEISNVIERTELYSRFKSMLRHYKHFISIINNEIILIVESTVPKSIISTLNQSTFLQKFTLGIGYPVSTNDKFEDSYKVASFIATKQSLNVDHYLALQDEYMIHTTDQTAVKLLINNVLGNLTTNEIEKYLLFLDVYEKHNGSINGMAAELYIHKNTVQYRLDRIYEKTSYNPREIKDYYLLRLAFNSWKQHFKE